MWAIAGLSSAFFGVLSLRRHEDPEVEEYLPVIGRTCTFWLAVAAAVDFVFGALIATSAEQLINLQSAETLTVDPRHNVFYWIIIGSAVPVGLRSSVLNRLGRARWVLVYTPIREHIRECYFDAALSDRQGLVEADTERAMKLGIKPQGMANAMKDWIDDHPRQRRRRRQRCEEVDGAMQRTTREDKLRRLISLTYKYSMGGVRKQLFKAPTRRS